jgi:hypothetical protein
MKEDNDDARREAERFVRSVEDPDTANEIPVQEQINMLRGVCCFLLQQLQKTYMYTARHANGHDTLLHQDLGKVFGQVETMLTVYFPDFLIDDGEEIEEDGESDI